MFTEFANGLQRICTDQNRTIEGLNQIKRDRTPHFPPISPALAQHLLRQAVLGCLGAYDVGPEIRVVGEKTPSSALPVASIFTVFPDAKVLNIVRDGRDMAISAWYHNLRLDRERFSKTFPRFDDFLPHIARVWVDHQAHILALPETPSCRQIHYEDLLDDPAPVVAGVFDWLGVASDEQTVMACLEATRFEVMSGGRKPGEVDPNSFYRIGTQGQWRTDLNEAQNEVFWDIAGETMSVQGYDRDGRVR